MPAISNLNKAYKQINQAMNDHQGQLTIGIAKSFFEKAVTEFNLSGEKVSELQAMKFDRNIDKEDLTDIQQAHRQINQCLLKHEGDLTKEDFAFYFNESVKEFNLEAREAELRGFQFERAITNPSKKEAQPESDESILERQAIEIQNLKDCMSEIATLAGYANYLGKYGLKRTDPAKRK